MYFIRITSRIALNYFLYLCSAEQQQDGNAGALDVEAALIPHKVTYKDLFLRFVWMGWVAFGGPTAHIALFQKVTTERFLTPLGTPPSCHTTCFSLKCCSVHWSYSHRAKPLTLFGCCLQCLLCA